MQRSHKDMIAMARLIEREFKEHLEFVLRWIPGGTRGILAKQIA